MKKPKAQPALVTAGWWRVNSIEWECTHCGHQVKLKLGEQKPPVCPACGGMKTNWEWNPTLT